MAAHEISTDSPTGSLPEILAEYKIVRGMVLEDRWTSSYGGRLEHRKMILAIAIADRVADKHEPSENVKEQENE